MASFHKYLFVLLATVLPFVCAVDRCAIPVPVHEKTSSFEPNRNSYAKNNLTKFVTQDAEAGLNSLTPSTYGQYRERADLFVISFFTLEVRLQHAVSHYILFSKNIALSLTSRDIIFPFQYFW
ncbi:hypothetical protein [Pontibacter burrus]|uniref:Uncharacterized protein n=1 Tax=Pontibacter burrus TaxID=2704466 RepID=A0A6B3LW29_9BACT|nr:hypothetical protein [Pontibacter burrus]NEM97697.1 hypothetical protein [Pontibacter burrus]